MEILTVILLILLAKKIVDVICYLANADINGVVTQFIAWAVGILTVFLAIWADTPLTSGDAWPRILWGLYLGSAASAVHDICKAIAKAWSPRELLPPRPVATPAHPERPVV